MTRNYFEQSDRTKANQATTHNRSDIGAFTSVTGNKCAPEPTPRAQRVEGPPLDSPFQDGNDDLMWHDFRDETSRFLIAGTRFLMAFIVAGIATLIIVSLTR